MPFKRTITKLASLSCASVLFITALMTACGNTKPSSGSGDASKSSAADSSAGDGFVYGKDGYIDVKASGAKSSSSRDNSKFFPEGAKGYIVNDGVYPVDADTLRRLTVSNVVGNGSVKWKSYVSPSSTGTPNTGIIPVAKLKDPLYVTMNMPNEAHAYIELHPNAENMNKVEPNFAQANSIAAVIKNSDKELPDDAEVTLCFGRMTLIECTKSNGWQMIQDEPRPVRSHTMYSLPWRQGDGMYKEIPPECIKYFDDHTEVTLPGSAFNATGDYAGSSVTERCLHYFNSGVDIVADDAVAFASSTVVWVKQKEYEDYFLYSAGVDQYTTDKKIRQAFNGMYTLIKSTPRIAFGHSVGTADYDKYMDSEKVSQMLGLKDYGNLFYDGKKLNYEVGKKKVAPKNATKITAKNCS